MLILISLLSLIFIILVTDMLTFNKSLKKTIIIFLLVFCSLGTCSFGLTKLSNPSPKMARFYTVVKIRGISKNKQEYLITNQFGVTSVLHKDSFYKMHNVSLHRGEVVGLFGDVFQYPNINLFSTRLPRGIIYHYRVSGLTRLYNQQIVRVRPFYTIDKEDFAKYLYNSSSSAGTLTLTNVYGII